MILSESAKSEGFQAKDAVSVQKRVVDVRQGAPLAPKVDSPTGVLESADILDNVPLQQPTDAGTVSSVPSSTFGSAMIQPPPESSVPIPSTRENFLSANPVLQNGPDHGAVVTALEPLGTGAAADASVAGVTTTGSA